MQFLEEFYSTFKKISLHFLKISRNFQEYMTQFLGEFHTTFK